MEDEGGPFGVALQGEASNRPLLRWLNTIVVSDAGKGALDVSGRDQKGERKRIADDVSKETRMTSKPGCTCYPGMSLAGARLLARWVSGMEARAQLLWRVWSNLRLPVLEWLPDGSYRSVLINPRIRGRRRERLLAAAAAGQDVDPAEAMVVRVAEYMIDNRPGGGELLGRTPPRIAPLGFPARPAPGVRLSPHRALHVSCQLVSRWRPAGSMSTGSYPAAAVAVAGDRDAGCAGEGDPVVGDPPSDVAEATSEFFHSEPVLARVLGPYPPHQPTPRVVVDRAEHVLGHPVPEVGRPPDQVWLRLMISLSRSWFRVDVM